MCRITSAPLLMLNFSKRARLHYASAAIGTALSESTQRIVCPRRAVNLLCRSGQRTLFLGFYFLWVPFAAYQEQQASQRNLGN